MSLEKTALDEDGFRTLRAAEIKHGRALAETCS